MLSGNKTARPVGGSNARDNVLKSAVWNKLAYDKLDNNNKFIEDDAWSAKHFKQLVGVDVHGESRGGAAREGTHQGRRRGWHARVQLEHQSLFAHLERRQA